MQCGVLGPLEVREESGRPVAIGGRQQRTLLALLLLNANQVVSADWLIAQLWGPQPPANARGLLHGCIAQLRRALRTGEGGAERQPLLTRPPGYLLEVHPGELDLHRVDELDTAAGEAAAAGSAADLARAAALLAEALAVWRGPALADVAGEECAADATRLEERRLALLERRVDLDLRLGRHADLAGELQAQIREHPLRESLWARLVLALYAAGRQADALAAYRRLREILVEQLGIEPSAPLQQLELAILAGIDAAELIRQEAGGPPAQPAAPVPPRPAPRPTGATVPAQLPAAVPAFTGRAGPLAELDALLAGQDGPPAGPVLISAVAGTAGVGKTALAVHWAHQVAGRFADGQLYVNLRGHSPAPPVRPVEALAGFLQALGVPAEQIPVEPEQAAALYRTLLAGKRVLVLLDNAGSAEQVRPLLPGSPGCLVLVTSRDRLGGLVARDGAAHLTLDVLTPGEATALLAGILGESRVAAEPAAAAELARACAYLPLALRIAAANLAVNPRRTLAEQVAALAGDRLAALQVDGHEAVRAALDLSYAALDPAAGRLFRLLGLIPGADVTTGAAAAAAGTSPGEAATLLDRLAAASLLTQPEPGRYTCHDLLRRYAAERARAEEPAGEQAAATARLHGWCLATLDAAARLLYPQLLRLPEPPAPPTPPAEPTGFADRPGAIAWLDAERANLLATAADAAEHGAPAVAVALTDALRGYFWLRVRPVDWLTAADLGRSAAEAAGDLRGQAAGWLSRADAHLVLARYPQAAEHYSRAAELAEQAGWPAGRASAYGNLGMVYRELGQLELAADCFVRALAIDRQTGGVSGQAARLANLSNVYLELGRLEQARGHLDQALALYRQLGWTDREAQVLANLGLVNIRLGRLDTAAGLAATALQRHRQVGNRVAEADALCILAEVHRDTGRPAEALDLVRAALALAEETGNRRFELDGRLILATIHHRLGHYDQAVAQHQQTLLGARAAGAQFVEVGSLIGLALGHRSLDHPNKAARYARHALARARRGGYRLLEGQAQTALAAVQLDLGHLDEALDEARQALALHRSTGHRPGEAGTLLLLSQILHGRGDPAADTHWQQAQALLADLAPLEPAEPTARPGPPARRSAAGR